MDLIDDECPCGNSSDFLIVCFNVCHDVGTLGTFNVAKSFSRSAIKLFVHLCFFFININAIPISYNEKIWLYRLNFLSLSSHSRVDQPLDLPYFQFARSCRRTLGHQIGHRKIRHSRRRRRRFPPHDNYYQPTGCFRTCRLRYHNILRIPSSPILEQDHLWNFRDE